MILPTLEQLFDLSDGGTKEGIFSFSEGIQEKGIEKACLDVYQKKHKIEITKKKPAFWTYQFTETGRMAVHKVGSAK